MPSSSRVTNRPRTAASSVGSGPVPAAPHDFVGSGFVRSFRGMVTSGKAASKAAATSTRSRPSASMRATRYARSVCCTATDTGLRSTSPASGFSAGSRDWSTVGA